MVLYKRWFTSGQRNGLLGGIYTQIAAFTDFRERIINNISQIIVGKNDLLDSIVIAFICGGHILLEDIPGVGKTSLVKAFARSVGSRFSRVQFTPDLLPSDLTGLLRRVLTAMLQAANCS